ncbi:MAG TPA: ATP-binding protein, partial [Chroococcidiopsis sp.]
AMLIDGLLTLSRVGRRQMERRSVSLQPLVEHAIAIVSSDPQVSQRTEFIVEPLPTVLGDAALLQQVFSNLIENAVKFSRDRQPARIHIGCLPDDTIFVADNGVGFNMDYVDQIFGAFQRLHSKQEFAGTGIGLAIVQRIIHRHGGTIWAESIPSQGATFYIRFAPP